MPKADYITECAHCSNEVEIDTSVMLMTNPPQYRAICSYCDDFTYVLAHNLHLYCTKDKVMNKKLAKITKAHLEIKEHGVLNFWIHVIYEDGTAQGIGGIALDTYNKISKSREGTKYGCEMIRRLLLTLNVNDFSEMNDKIVWVYGQGESLGFLPKGIGLLQVTKKDNTPLIFEEVYKEFKENSND